MNTHITHEYSHVSDIDWIRLSSSYKEARNTGYNHRKDVYLARLSTYVGTQLIPTCSPCFTLLRNHSETAVHHIYIKIDRDMAIIESEIHHLIQPSSFPIRVHSNPPLTFAKGLASSPWNGIITQRKEEKTRE